MAGWLIGFSMTLWLTIGIMLVMLAVRSLVLVQLWAWFVVPLFGLPQLSYAAAGGLMLIVMLCQIGAQQLERDGHYGEALRVVERVHARCALACGWDGSECERCRELRSWRDRLAARQR